MLTEGLSGRVGPLFDEESQETKEKEQSGLTDDGENIEFVEEERLGEDNPEQKLRESKLQPTRAEEPMQRPH